jgi:transcriptional regulator with PAS, ATPase and Fis domain
VPGGLEVEPAARAGAERALPSRAILARAFAGAEALLLTAGGEGPARELLGRESVVRGGVRAVIAAPLIAAGRRLGLIYADRLTSGGRFDDEDLAYLADFARQLAAAVVALERTGEARDEAEAWRRLARPAAAEPELTGESPAFRAALDLARKAAPSAAPVLVQGETGTGKELVARFVHGASPRAGGPFVPVNCAALPESLLESELFGHERGAFTGADRRRRGLVELARGGTLFLDEIGEMPLALQAKLLRVLEEKEVRRLGSEAATKVDFRLVAATNRDLAALVREGRFREDLYYRLAVFAVTLPPLRERPGDAERLARHLAGRMAGGGRRPPPALSEEAVAALRRYAWPGNVRELRNAIDRALVLAPPGGPIEPAHLGLASTGAAGAGGGGGGEVLTLEEAERRAVAAALAASGGKKGEAARILGTSLPTLRKKMADYGLA